MTPSPSTTHRVVVLSGGDSDEREVSLESGAAVAAALRNRGHAVRVVDPAHTVLEAFDFREVDVVFNALHGRYGEDGQVQQLLEELGIPFTGSDSETSQLAFRKSAAKERFAYAGVPTPASVLVHETDDAGRIARLAESIGYPLVVKPDRQGSSLGISIVRSPDHLAGALARCFHYDDYGLFETYVEGSEWTLGLIDDEVLPLLRITPPAEVFDYDAKYAETATRHEFDVDEPAAVTQLLIETGRRAARALNTRGPARVDLKLSPLGGPTALEVNTIPGFTAKSLLPKAAAQAGISFEELCARALQSAFVAAQQETRQAA